MIASWPRLECIRTRIPRLLTRTSWPRSHRLEITIWTRHSKIVKTLLPL